MYVFIKLEKKTTKRRWIIKLIVQNKQQFIKISSSIKCHSLYISLQTQARSRDLADWVKYLRWVKKKWPKPKPPKHKNRMLFHKFTALLWVFQHNLEDFERSCHSVNRRKIWLFRQFFRNSRQYLVVFTDFFSQNWIQTAPEISSWIWLTRCFFDN